MNNKRNSVISKIINVIVFLVHLALSIGFLLMGWVSVGFMGATPTAQDIFTRNLAYAMGIILLIVTSITLYKTNIKKYIILISTTILLGILWIIIEGSMDMKNFLIVYVIVFIPLIIIKNRLDKKQKTR